MNKQFIIDRINYFVDSMGFRDPVEYKPLYSNIRFVRLIVSKLHTKNNQPQKYRFIIQLNQEILTEYYNADPTLTNKVLDYSITHELAHGFQVYEYGFKTILPKFMLEEKADAIAFKTCNISEQEIREIINKLNNKVGRIIIKCL